MARQKEAYSVEEIQAPGTTIHEYVDSDGVVFAVTWIGHRHPDLAPLLGTYADDYAKADRKSKKRFGLRSRKIAGSQVVVEKWGHMRALQGRAYDPALLPEGVSVDEIR